MTKNTKQQRQIVGMTTEIKDVIRYYVACKQAKSVVNIPPFMEEKQVWKDLQIKSFSDLKSIYERFSKKNLVSGKYC